VALVATITLIACMPARLALMMAVFGVTTALVSYPPIDAAQMPVSIKPIG
jgi:hypothetical protein